MNVILSAAKNLLSRGTVAGLALLAGCEGIGDGSTLQSIEIMALDTSQDTTPFKLHRCLRDQLAAIATFTDGTKADFSYRVKWTSSDPNVVQVSNGDVPSTLLSDGAFVESSTIDYVPGVLIPKAATGTATITAEFLGIDASREVEIYTPVLKIAPVGQGRDPQDQPPGLVNFLAKTTLRYAFFIERHDGATILGSTLNAAALNPILWRFEGGVLDVADPAVTGDFDKYVVPDTTNPTMEIAANTGAVNGLAADDAIYTVEAVTALCEATDPDFDPAFIQEADVRVVALAATDPLELAHEADFNGPGVTTGDIVGGTAELMRVLANLDVPDDDGDPGTPPAGNVQQDISSASALKLTYLTACTEGDPNCTCDVVENGPDINCTKRLFTSTGNLLLTTVNNDFADVAVAACFTQEDTVHSDDCSETTPILSDPLTVRLVPVDLSGTGASLAIHPATPAPQPAFTYPGPQFNVFGTFTATKPEQPFDGDAATAGVQASTTGIQKVTRYSGFSTRPHGSTTEFSDIGGVRNTGDGFFETLGTFTYIKDVAENTIVDIYVTPAAPFASIAAPEDPVEFTICPSTGCVP